VKKITLVAAIILFAVNIPILVAGASPTRSGEIAKQPNVLFIVIDDLNDWVGCLGGHSQAQTPNLEN